MIWRRRGKKEGVWVWVWACVVEEGEGGEEEDGRITSELPAKSEKKELSSVGEGVVVVVVS